MKKMNRNFWILTLLLFSTAELISQNVEYISERNQGYYTLGLNTGFAYQSSDVKNVFDGYGVGVTLAKNLYYQPGAPFLFDVRGRFLYDKTYGLDVERSNAIENNDALNGTGKLDYTSEGFVFANFQTRKAELGLEGVLHFNRLRERTRFDLSLYGGIGLDWYKTKIDQQNREGNYDYSVIDTDASNSTIRTQLRNNILDGTYETNAHDFGNAGKLRLMPGVGFDLEYNLTKRFSIGVGHKFTFPRNDKIDGQLWNPDNTLSSDNDIHHYTNLDLRWIIDPGKKKLNEPIIDVTKPNSSPYTASYCDGDVRANIKYVSNAADVNFTVNGTPTAYTFRGESFKATFPLKPGRNEVKISAHNSAGSDHETVLIYCEEVSAPPPTPPVVYRPEVKITRPSYNDFETNDPNFALKATVENIQLKSDIEFYVNGSRANFNFDPKSSRLESDLRLNTGRNLVKIVARNSAGQDQDDCTIIYGYSDVKYPTVNIKSPSANPYQTTGSRVNVSAITTGIDSKSDIDFIINGRETNDFSFNASREKVESTVRLEEGRNVIEIRVRNDKGTADDQTTVIYSNDDYDVPPVPNVPGNAGLKPVVEFTRPSSGSSNTSENTAIIKAFVRRVDSKNDIRLTLNGSPFNFTYNPSSEIVITTVQLQKGKNTIAITGTNRHGSATESVIIRQLAPVGDVGGGNISRKPDVNITIPNNNSTTSNKNATVKAKVKEVKGKSEIKLTLNGNNISNFSYNNVTRQVTANVTLKSGSNTIKVTATNSGGTDSDQVKVTLNSTPPVSKPVVRITTPKNNSTVTKKVVNMKASVTNVTRKSDVKVTLNGKAVTFNFNNGIVSSTMTLKSGKNAVKVSASNSAGSDNATSTVNYKKLTIAKKPVITVIAPKANTSKKNTISLQAKIEHITSKKDIKLTVNGKNYSVFSFASSTKMLTATIKLKAGSNKIDILATNKAGKDKETVSVKYIVESVDIVEKPVVTINSIGQPVSDPFNPGPLSSSLLATINLVDNKKQILLRVNGQTIKNFTFDAKKGTLRYTFNIVDGTNSIRIEATNSAGTTLVTRNVDF